MYSPKVSVGEVVVVGAAESSLECDLYVDLKLMQQMGCLSVKKGEPSRFGAEQGDFEQVVCEQVELQSLAGDRPSPSDWLPIGKTRGAQLALSSLL